MQHKKTSKMNISKYIMVIAAAVITIGTAAFKGIEMVKTEKTNVDEVEFYNLGDGLYSRNEPTGTTCLRLEEIPCKIIYENKDDVEGIDQFDYTAPPSGNRSESPEKGKWE